MKKLFETALDLKIVSHLSRIIMTAITGSVSHFLFGPNS